MSKLVLLMFGCLTLATGWGVSLPVIPQVRSFTVRDEGTFCDVETARFRCEMSAVGYGEEGYRMELTPKKILVSVGGRTGIVRAKATVAQLREAAVRGVKIPCGRIEDMPNSPLRGLRYDEKETPRSFDTLTRLARTMSSYKLNYLSVKASASDEFCAFTNTCASLGVRVVPEITIPKGVTNAVIATVSEADTWEKVLPMIQTLSEKAWSGNVTEK